MLKPMAEVLRNLDSERVWVVHGADGLDEITTTGPTRVVSLENGKIETFEITPEDADLPRAVAADLKGGDPDHNARALRAVLDGARTPYRDIALFNAAAALIIAGRADDLRQGVALASGAIADGSVKATLARLIDVTNRT